MVNTSLAKKRKIEYIVIHYTAGTSSAPGKAAATASYFMNGNSKASSDFIIDDATVVQYNGDIANRYTWHCGGSKLKTAGGQYYGKCTNKNSISIELCSSNAHGSVTTANDTNWYFTDDVVLLARELVKKLMDEYKIPLKNVIRHYDVTGKYCPGIYGWNADSGDESEWEDFKSSIIVRDDMVGDVSSSDEYQDLLDRYNKLKSKYDAIAAIIKSK